MSDRSVRALKSSKLQLRQIKISMSLTEFFVEVDMAVLPYSIGHLYTWPEFGKSLRLLRLGSCEFYHDWQMSMNMNDVKAFHVCKPRSKQGRGSIETSGRQSLARDALSA